MTSRWQNSQRILWNMNSACFFLTLLSIAEEFLHEKVDLLDSARHCMNKGWMDSEYFINNDTLILGWLTGKKVTKQIYDGNRPLPLLKANQYSAAKYGLNGGNHFRRRYFDVYEGSRTVEQGVLLAYYVYTIG